MTAIRLAFFLTAGCLLAAGVTAAAEPAPPLGRLFLTPEWRAALERQRQLNIQESRNLEGDAVRLDGVVVRSSGKSTVWINNRPQTENARDAGVLATPSRQRPDRASVATGMEPPADLKVGATLNQATRETSGGLTGGEIRVRRPAPRN